VSSSLAAAVVFVLLSAAVILGRMLGSALPERHWSAATHDMVKISLGLIATMAALLLGLLVSSAKESHDRIGEQLNEMAAKVALLDRVLQVYGDEAADARAALRDTMRDAIARAWPEDGSPSRELAAYSEIGESILIEIAALSPQTALHADLKSKGTTLALELVERRALLRAQTTASVSMPLLVVVVGWLFVIQFGFGAISPSSPTALSALIISAAAVCGAVFLLLELYHPFEGMIRISNAPLLQAMETLPSG
jgi:hypothetical protein